MLSIEDLAAIYEMRHGFDEPTPWKRIAIEFGMTADAISSAVKRIEQRGIIRDANGLKPKSRPTQISDTALGLIEIARKAGNTWPQIGAAMGLSPCTVQSRYRRWKILTDGKR